MPGHKCGAIKSYDMVKNVLVVEVPAQHGDSGGPAWIGNVLVGTVHSTYANYTMISLLKWDILHKIDGTSANN